MTYREIQTHALRLGITFLEGIGLEDYAPLSDGCSGGLSSLYAIAGKEISCHRCCVAHDFLYGWGGTDKDRKKADTLLRECALEIAGDNRFKRFRAWTMYYAVRACGGWWPGAWAGKQIKKSSQPV